MKFGKVLLCAVLVGTLLLVMAMASMAQLAVGSRAIGMGGAFTAVSDDASAPYFNPAGLTKMQGFHMQVPSVQVRIKSNLDWRDIVDNPPTSTEDRLVLLSKLKSGTSTVDVSANLGFVSPGLAVSIIPQVNAKLDATNINFQFDANGHPVYDASNLAPQSASISGNAAAAIGVSFARQLKDGAALGVTLKSVRTKNFTQVTTYTPNIATMTIDDSSATTRDDDASSLGIDVGYMKEGTLGTTYGVMIRNLIEPSGAGAFGDRQISLGMAHKLAGDKVLLAADIENLFNHPSLNLGAEFTTGKALTLWTGIYERKLTFGVGLNIFGLKAQYAYSPDDKSIMSGSISF